MTVAPDVGEARLPAEGLDAAEELFAAHSGWVYGYCLRVLRSPEEAEDALQTTYLNACRSLNQGVRPRVGSAWLLRIAQNVCLTRLRSSGRRSAVERPHDFAALQDTVAAPDQAKDDLVGLTDALLGLPERQRKAILLREWQGLTYDEIAAELGITQAAVETLIFRARRSLAAGLETPPKRSRLRSVLAFDFAGALATIKGLFAGSAGVKAATALTVVAATTTTVVATDSSGILRDRERPLRASTPAAVEASTADVTATPVVAGAPGPTRLLDVRTEPAQGNAAKKARAKDKGKPTATRGGGPNGHGNPNGNGNGGSPNANGNGSQGNGKAQAPGQLKETGAPAQGKGQPAAGAKPAAAAGQDGPPPHAKASEKAASQGKAAG